MTYIIENANVLSEQNITTTSFLVKHDRITSVLSSIKKLTHMRMDAEPFIMTPTYVFFDQQISEDRPFQETRQYFLEQFIKKGCTTILTTVDIQYENDFSLKMKRKQTNLNTCPIDYIIAARIPVRLLTPSFIRKCKKERIPAIFVEIEDVTELYMVPWGWVREALFPYNCPLIPIFTKDEGKAKQQLINTWRKITQTEKIPSLADEISEHQPIPKQILAKIGIYPLKSNLLHGGELSYNFYLMDHEKRQISELEMFHYHNHRLVVTMHKGHIIRAGEKAMFRSGFGEQVMINKPSFYLL
ncbi:MAG: hypothetical protein K0S25_227 [Bacillus sp. (in: firmicutes)]|nr:hypothetical protein [Bacillus sp. (in: firmicutes)]